MSLASTTVDERLGKLFKAWEDYAAAAAGSGHAVARIAAHTRLRTHHHRCCQTKGATFGIGIGTQHCIYGIGKHYDLSSWPNALVLLSWNGKPMRLRPNRWHISAQRARSTTWQDFSLEGSRSRDTARGGTVVGAGNISMLTGL